MSGQTFFSGVPFGHTCVSSKENVMAKGMFVQNCINISHGEVP